MCGIAGWIAISGRSRPHPEQTEAMLGRLCHRGPDGKGVYQQGGVSVGMNRLAIVGQAPGLPFTNATGSVVVAFNGEIYNWRELTSEVLGDRFGHQAENDGAVLPYLFEVLGNELFERMEGMYAIAIWDSRSEKLYLVRDRLGIKPLFWWQQDDIVAFSSELQAFRAWTRFPPPLAEEWIAPYLCYRFVPHPHTLLRQVWKVSPGTAVCFRYGRSQPSALRYWTLGPAGGPRPESRGAAVEQLDDLLRRIIRDHRVPVGVPSAFLLSGGVDSSVVTALSVREGAAFGPALTLTDIRNHEEEENARRIAAMSGITLLDVAGEDASAMHLEEMLAALDEPLADPTAMSLALVLRHAQDRFRVVLSGEGADEVFLGYSVYRRARWHQIARLLARRTALAQPLTQTYFGVGGTFRSEDLPSVLGPDMRATARPWFPDLPATSSAIRTLQAIDLLYSLPDDVLTKADRLSMRWSMEFRVPFLDHRLVQWVWALPEGWLGTNGDKPLLRRVAARYIPHRVAYRPKSGFPTPLSAWLTGAWREWVDDMIQGPVSQRGFWNMEGIVQLRQRVNPEGKSPAGRQLFAVLALEAWLAGLKSGLIDRGGSGRCLG